MRTMILSALLGLMSCAAANAAVIEPGNAAPNFSARTLDGRTVTLSDFRGKVLVVNFWGSTCAACRLETPDLIKSYLKHENAGVAFVGMDSEEQAPVVRAFVAAKHVPYTIALDQNNSIDRAYGVTGYPTTYVIDAKGIIRAVSTAYSGVDGEMVLRLAAYITAAKQETNYTADTDFAALAAPLDVVRERQAEDLLEPSRYAVVGNAATVAAAADAARGAFKKIETIQEEAADGHKRLDDVGLARRAAALRDRMVAALEPLARHDVRAEKALLAMRINKAMSVEDYQKIDWRAIEPWATRLLALDPAGDQSTGYMLDVLESSKPPKQKEALTLALRHANDMPSPLAYDYVVGAYANLNMNREAQQWEQKALKLSIAREKGAPTAAAVSDVAYQARVLGMLSVDLKDPVVGKPAFALAIEYMKRMPDSPARSRGIEEANEGLIALAATGDKVALAIAPWVGAPLPGSSPNTIKFRLAVSGKAGSSVTLTASRYAKGWLPTFCGDGLCSPVSRTVVLSNAGVKIIEFQMVPNDARAPKRSSVIIVGSDGTSNARAMTSATAK